MRRALVLALSLAPRVVYADPPSLVLWAWERPEDLRFLPPEVGVAYHRATVVVTPGGVRVAPRRQPLRMREGAWRMPVVRVELRPRTVALSPEARAAVVGVFVRAAGEAGVGGVQIDFDAPASRRQDHALLVAAVRQGLPAGTWLSMTALASWCMDDRWLGRPPVDEVVPMVFSMGRDGATVRGELARRGRFVDPVCRESVGWAEGEPTVELRGVRRRYVFSARPWTQKTARRWLVQR